MLDKLFSKLDSLIKSPVDMISVFIKHIFILSFFLNKIFSESFCHGATLFLKMYLIILANLY